MRTRVWATVGRNTLARRQVLPIAIVSFMSRLPVAPQGTMRVSFLQRSNALTRDLLTFVCIDSRRSVGITKPKDTWQTLKRFQTYSLEETDRFH